MTFDHTHPEESQAPVYMSHARTYTPSKIFIRLPKNGKPPRSPVPWAFIAAFAITILSLDILFILVR